MRQRYGGPTLPKELRDQIGDPANRRKTSRGRNAPLNRKERRKAEREDRKVGKTQVGRNVHNGKRRVHLEPESEHESEDAFEDESPPPRPALTRKELQKPVKSNFKKPQTEIRPIKEPSPSPPSKVSRATKDKLAQDDAEIAALEKRLGIKGRKKSKSANNVLDDIFGVLGGFSSDEDMLQGKTSKRKREQDDEWLASKRQKALGGPAEESNEEYSELEDIDEIVSAEEEFDEEIDDDTDDEDMDGRHAAFAGFDSNEDEDEDNEDSEHTQFRVRENPYVAPVAPDIAPTTKYVPPALREAPSSDAEALTRLKRQTQGLLNRLSDANVLIILRDIEQVYQNNPRGYVTTTLVDLLIGLLADETTLLDTFLILHAGFIAAIYKVIGPDFGAQMVERIVSEFDKHYSRNKSGAGKQTTNLISVVAELYCFQVIGSNLMFDYIRLFLDELSEINTELLLRIVRVSGSQLRQDDPTSLKDIVLLLQKSVTNVGESNLPVRTKFMIETINDLKNNKQKAGVAASAIASEHTIRMKKQLGTLNTRTLKGTEPLRIGLIDIKDTEKKGKWWLVGASWRDNMANSVLGQERNNADSKQHDHRNVDDEESGEVDLLQLAREQRMNTDIRRAIFVTIMSASDYKDAHIRLLKLNLKKAQEMEIPRVIVHCAGCEKTYNPYYTLLARKFCSDHKSRKCFQFALWDVFKGLGEKRADEDLSDDEYEESDNDMSLRKLVNLGKLYGTLIAKDGLPITSLKTLNFPYLKTKTKTFIEILLVTVILETQKRTKRGRNEKELLNIFINVDAAMEMIAGLQYFLKKVVSKTDIAASKAEKETIKWACKLVMDMLTRLMATTTLGEDG